MKIALIQYTTTGTMKKNYRRALFAMEEAASKGARLVCFPEIQLTPFFPQFPRRDASAYAITIDHEIVTGFRQKSRELDLYSFPNLYLKDDNHCYDATLVIGPDGDLLGISKMVHVAQAPYFYEQDYYTPADDGFKVYDTSLGKIGVVICFDRHFPESLRTCALRGAQLIIVPTANTEAEPMEIFEWEMRIAAIQNGVFIAMCNRVGIEDEMTFAGQSLVVGPDGDVIEKGDNQEQIIFGNINLSLVGSSHASRHYLKLRRPETYEK